MASAQSQGLAWRRRHTCGDTGLWGGHPAAATAVAGAARRTMTSKTGTRAAFCAWVRSMHAAHRLEFRRAGDPWLAPVPPRDRPPAERTDRGPAAGAGHP